MGFKTRGISQTTRFKRRPSTSGRPCSGGLIKVSLESNTKRIDSTSPSRPSPTAAPFNSTSFLIRQKSRYQEEEAPGAFKQYGTNVGNMITSCSIAYDPDCCYQCLSQDPIIVNMSNHDFENDVSKLQLQLQGIQVTDCPGYSDYQPRSHAGFTMETDSSYSAHDQGGQALLHRRVRSFTDDNFDLFYPSNANSCYDLLENTLLERL